MRDRTAVRTSGGMPDPTDEALASCLACPWRGVACVVEIDVALWETLLGSQIPHNRCPACKVGEIVHARHGERADAVQTHIGQTVPGVRARDNYERYCVVLDAPVVPGPNRPRQHQEPDGTVVTIQPDKRMVRYEVAWEAIDREPRPVLDRAAEWLQRHLELIRGQSCPPPPSCVD